MSVDIKQKQERTKWRKRNLECPEPMNVKVKYLLDPCGPLTSSLKCDGIPSADLACAGHQVVGDDDSDISDNVLLRKTRQVPAIHAEETGYRKS